MTKTTAVLKRDLKHALKNERDHRVVLRIVAVNMVVANDKSVTEAADAIMMSDDWVRKWVDRYGDGGLDALRDLPRTGRPTKVGRDKLANIIKDASEKRLLPRELADTIKTKTGVSYCSRQVRRILHDSGMSPKKMQRVHVTQASPAVVKSWQRREKAVIRDYKRAGYTIAWQDEAHRGVNMDSSVRFWSKVGLPVSGTFSDQKGRVSIHTMILENKRHVTRQYGFANSDTFISHLKDAHRAHGPIVVYADRAKYHKSDKVKEFLRTHPEIVVRYLPVGASYINPAEHPWMILNKSSVSFSYHASFKEFLKALAEHFRTVRYNIDPMACMYRSPIKYAAF